MINTELLLLHYLLYTYNKSWLVHLSIDSKQQPTEKKDGRESAVFIRFQLDWEDVIGWKSLSSMIAFHPFFFKSPHCYVKGL